MVSDWLAERQSSLSRKAARRMLRETKRVAVIADGGAEDGGDEFCYNSSGNSSGNSSSAGGSSLVTNPLSPTSEKSAAKVKRDLDMTVGRLVMLLLLAMMPLVCCIIGGGLVLGGIEGWNVVDSLYTATITITSIGYGDISPKTQSGRMFDCFFIPVSVWGVWMGDIERERARERGRGREVLLADGTLTISLHLQVGVLIVANTLRRVSLIMLRWATRSRNSS
jgi:hypothetical protein